MITEHIGNLLVSLGYGTLGTDIFCDRYPSTPDSCIVVSTTGGQAPTWVQDNAGVSTELPTFQVMARAKSSVEARDKVYSIYNDLQRIGNQLVDGVFFQRLVPLQTPFLNQQDQNDRTQWMVNFLAEKDAG